MSENKYPNYAPDTDARSQAPTFDEMVGLIEKLFKDSLIDTKLFTDAEIEQGWHRYKTLNHLYQDEKLTPEQISERQVAIEWYRNPAAKEQVEINMNAGMPENEASFQSGYSSGHDAGYSRAQREFEKAPKPAGAVWVPCSQMPIDDSWEDYPRKYILCGHNDGRRGEVDIHHVTYEEMKHVIQAYDWCEWLDESGTVDNKETPGVKALYDALTYIYGALIDPVTAKRCSTQMLNKANQAICKYKKELKEPGVSNNDAIEFAEWLRDNTIADGAPKLLHKLSGERKTTADLHQLWQQSNSK